MQGPPTTVIDTLREATAASHRSIEASLQLEDAGLHLPRYVRTLGGFEAFLSHWEPRIAALLPRHLQQWFASRSRRLFAQRDLAVLGAPLIRLHHDPLHGVRLDGVAAAFGSLYVLEGSALGGRVIAARVRAHLGLERDGGAAYFTGWGEHTPALWRDFRGRLEDEVGTQAAARAAACSAAVQTFEALGSVFEEVLADEPEPHLA